MSSKEERNKEVIRIFREALYDLEADKLKEQLEEVLAPDCLVHMCHPFGDITGPAALVEKVYAPLIRAIPDLERRDFIVMAGDSTGSGEWVGCGGNYVGVFEKPWLSIPPTQHPVIMRYHEFFRIEEGKVVEMQVIWDIVHLMMQAQAWPLTPSLGVDWATPGPATEDGLLPVHNPALTAPSLKIVLDMLEGLGRHAAGGPEAMELERYWHPKMFWYGPAGIGMNRRISGFRNWHQIPFLKAMPDRGDKTGLTFHFFAEGSYVATTGWPNMQMTLSGDGWLGIPPVDKKITMRSLDFWRCEKGLIRENWVLVDLLDVYNQLGVDVFCRMRECTVARQADRPAL